MGKKQKHYQHIQNQPVGGLFYRVGQKLGGSDTQNCPLTFGPPCIFWKKQ